MPQLLTALTAKLIVLIRACHLPENKTANVYTDCSNALGVLHYMLQNYFQLPLASLLKTVNKSQLVDPSHLPSYPLLKSQDFLKQTTKNTQAGRAAKTASLYATTQRADSSQVTMTTLLLTFFRLNRWGLQGKKPGNRRATVSTPRVICD